MSSNLSNRDSTPKPKSQFTKQTEYVQNFFSIPAPIKTLFDYVPVLVYPPNELPQRAPRPSRIPTLYVFSREEDVAEGNPSFNPGCLKWQVGRARSKGYSNC